MLLRPLGVGLHGRRSSGSGSSSSFFAVLASSASSCFTSSSVRHGLHDGLGIESGDALGLVHSRGRSIPSGGKKVDSEHQPAGVEGRRREEGRRLR